MKQTPPSTFESTPAATTPAASTYTPSIPPSASRFGKVGGFSYGTIPTRPGQRSVDIAASPGKPSQTLAASPAESREQAEALVPGSAVRSRPTVNSAARQRSTRLQGTFNDIE